MGIIGQMLGRDIGIHEFDEDAWWEKQLKHMPRPIIDSVTKGMRASNEGHNAHSDHAEFSANVLKYTEREPTKLVDWLKAMHLWQHRTPTYVLRIILSGSE